MLGFWQDARLAARRLRDSPGFTAAAALSLAVGIGASTTVFGLIEALLLRPLPVRDPATVVAVYTSDYSGPRYSASSYPDYLAFRESGAFDGLAAYTMAPLALAGQGAGRAWSEIVSGDYFETLGIPVQLGRGLAPSDDRPGAPPVAVLSHGLWQRAFGGQAEAVGRTLTLSGRACTIVGVARPGFAGLTRGLVMEAWVPMAMRPALTGDPRVLENRGERSLQLFGRLRPGVTTTMAEARLNALARSLRAEHPGEWSDVRDEARRVSLLPEWQARIPPMLSGPVNAFLGLLAAIVLLVLLTACANVATLFLVRLLRRRREVAVRLSLGAGRARLVRQLLAETLLVALLGGALGVVLAFAAADVLGALRLPLPVTVTLDVHPDLRVLGFTVALSLLAGAALGLLPSLQAARVDVLPGLKDDVGRWGRARLRGAFVVTQVALSLVLLCGALLFQRGLGRAAAIDPGFDASHVLALPADLVLSGYDEARMVVFQQRLLERVHALEGVQAVSLTAAAHLDPVASVRRGLSIQGYVAAADEDLEVHATAVGAGFFETMSLPIVRGRSFREADRPGSPPVAIVNESFARRYFPGLDPLGRRLSTNGDGGPFMEVVGVARDAKYASLGEAPRPFFYVPFVQDSGFVQSTGSFLPATVLVRTTGDPRSHAAAVRQAVQDLDPALALSPPRPLEDVLGLSVLPTRIAALGAFGALGLALAALGLSGVVAQSVAQRTREFGVRLALGADRGHLVRLALGEGSRLVAIGSALGLAMALALARLAREFLYGLSPSDPPAFAAAVALLSMVALGASFLPARRAGRVDPVASLRSE
jgi:predicted permease